MKYLRTALVLISALLLCSCGGSRPSKPNSKAVNVPITFGSEEPKGSGWAATHAPVNNWIKVGNKVFTKLNGFPPYYLQVPKSELIAVFQDVDTSMQMLVIDQSGEVISCVKEGISGIGYGVNSTNPDKDVITEFDGTNITLKSFRRSFFKTVIIDVFAGRVLSNTQEDRERGRG